MTDPNKHLDPLTLSLLVDDMLPPQETQHWMTHLDSCPHCEQAYKDLQAISFAMLKLEPQTPPPDFAKQILANLPPQEGVDPMKTIEIQENQVKISFLPSLDWQKIAMFAACAALAFSFLPKAPTMETVVNSSISGIPQAPRTMDETVLQESDEASLYSTSLPSDTPALSSFLDENNENSPPDYTLPIFSTYPLTPEEETQLRDILPLLEELQNLSSPLLGAFLLDYLPTTEDTTLLQSETSPAFLYFVWKPSRAPEYTALFEEAFPDFTLLDGEYLLLAPFS